MRLKPLAYAVALAAAATAARAGETACWYEQGLVVAPAQVAGVAGDYILDTGQAVSQLAETQAQGAGLTATALDAEIEIAGQRTRIQGVAVADIDVRTGLLPTPIAGVIGVDALRAYVVDLRLSPCRLRLSRPAQAPRIARATSQPLTWIDGRPTVMAGVADGPTARRGPFVVSTGADVAVRLSDALASAPGAAKPQELYPYGVSRPRLRALSFAQRLQEETPGGLIRLDGVLGQLGAPVLEPYALRFDFPAGRLLLTPLPKP